MREQYKYIPQLKTITQTLEKNKICHGDLNLRNVGINEDDKLVLYDMDGVKFLDTVSLEPKAVFVDTPEYIKYLKHSQRIMCYDRVKAWAHAMSVYLVDNTKKLERLDDVGYRRMGYRLIMFYKISREMKRRFWDVPLSRFYSYKRLDGVDDELIYKIFTNMTSDEAIAILKKFESKMVFIDEILTHLI